MRNSLAIMITTTQSREKVVTLNFKNLLKFIKRPFALYIYNDLAKPLKQLLKFTLEQANRQDVKVYILNDHKEISTQRVGCGGGRYYLFEMIKQHGHTIVASLDDDVLITNGWFANIMKAIQRFPNHSVFTSVIKHKNQPLQAGHRIHIDGIWLQRFPMAKGNKKCHVSDWGPVGNMVFCRRALDSHVKFPKDLVFGEDSAVFLLFKRLGINETIVVNDALVFHRHKTTKLNNFVTYANVQKTGQHIWSEYGISMFKQWRELNFVPNFTEVDKIRQFLNNPKYPNWK